MQLAHHYKLVCPARIFVLLFAERGLRRSVGAGLQQCEDLGSRRGAGRAFSQTPPELNDKRRHGDHTLRGRVSFLVRRRGAKVQIGGQTVRKDPNGG